MLAIPLVAIVIVGGVALIVSSSSSGGAPTPPTTPDNEAVTATVTRGTIRSIVVLDGVAVPAPTQTIKAPASGILVASKAVVGSSVRFGEEVARVELASGGSAAVVVPIGGLIQSWVVPDGDQVRLGDPLVTIDPGRFLADAVVAPELLYRFFGPPIAINVKLDKGPAPFACPFSSLGAPISASESDPSSVPVHLKCSIPEDVRVFAGLRLKLAAVTGESRDTLLLPLQAVAGEADRGFVTLIDKQGSASRRDVRLGLTNGVNIEITQGLDEGDRVAVPPVNGSSLVAL